MSLQTLPHVIPNAVRNLEPMPARRDRQYYVYILTNRTRTLYVGVTNDLEKEGCTNTRTSSQGLPGFTSKYNITWLAHYGGTSRPRT